MYKGRLGGGKVQIGYVETDPSGRYGRFKDVLGKGAMKVVYRAFDELLGIEVAWSQVKLSDVFNSPDQLQRLYSEVHLLKNLDHDSIMTFYTSWIDVNRRTFNFITELFTSGTLREYGMKYQRVSIRAVKNWARQILQGLEYLHSHDPPVIHRDLKCDNIFVNGHLGQVKIGDLGLAAILRGSHHAHSVIGTPEFMAPELYEEDYNELVDIYSFGMCMIEMLTSEFPYSECSNPAQIYKKVTSGKLPNAFYQIEDLEAQKLVGKCLANVSKRLPAKELLLDPFLAIDKLELPLPIPPTIQPQIFKFPAAADAKENSSVSDRAKSTKMTITGTLKEEDETVFLKVQISDKNGHARNIYFPFDIVNDTAIDVALEMVKELEIMDLGPFEIAEMIEEEILALVPTWKDWGKSQYNRQHSFTCEDEDEISDHHDDHPFFLSASSPSSSHASLSVPLHQNHLPFAEDWLQDELFMNDDASSSSSMNSFKYANFNYCDSGYEDEHDQIGAAEHICCSPKTTRFCPRQQQMEGNFGKKFSNLRVDSRKTCCSGSGGGGGGRCPRLRRMNSYVDVQSQHLQRSLMEEIHKRRMYKTVGAIENIGFQHPNGSSYFSR